VAGKVKFSQNATIKGIFQEWPANKEINKRASHHHSVVKAGLDF
jgi:hypothetical protein